MTLRRTTCDGRDETGDMRHCIGRAPAPQQRLGCRSRSRDARSHERDSSAMPTRCLLAHSVSRARTVKRNANRHGRGCLGSQLSRSTLDRQVRRVRR